MKIRIKANTMMTSCVALGLGFAALPAQAHFPLMSCWFEGKTVACEAGYSDGSKAIDYAVAMYDYEDNLIAKEMTDKRSIVEFPNPDTEFYLVFDSGHEFPVEVDVVEISEK